MELCQSYSEIELVDSDLKVFYLKKTYVKSIIYTKKKILKNFMRHCVNITKIPKKLLTPHSVMLLSLPKFVPFPTEYNSRTI